MEPGHIYEGVAALGIIYLCRMKGSGSARTDVQSMACSCTVSSSPTSELV